MFTIDSEAGSLAGGAKNLTFPIIDNRESYRQVGTLRLGHSADRRITLWEPFTPDELLGIATAAREFSYNVVNKDCSCCTR